eukprot:TRINITY_DN8970_c0_g1_i2.p1 TRINITY_DN8970_c0_g1~~TRINITY_DN8970_c0_g1_i2.p1  ORF type:complete len:445 (+),score=109.37 TRINITY_DN8970_c0_g1_i2:689-2023(+)
MHVTLKFGFMWYSYNVNEPLAWTSVICDFISILLAVSLESIHLLHIGITHGIGFTVSDMILLIQLFRTFQSVFTSFQKLKFYWRISERINSFPTLMKQQLAEANCPDCVICLRSLQRKAVRLPCGANHVFHKTCLVQWASRLGKLNCPICRSSHTNDLDLSEEFNVNNENEGTAHPEFNPVDLRAIMTRNLFRLVSSEIPFGPFVVRFGLSNLWANAREDPQNAQNSNSNQEQSITPSVEQPAVETMEQSLIEQVLAVMPQVPEEVVERELNKFDGNVELTVAALLDGRIEFQPNFQPVLIPSEVPTPVTEQDVSIVNDGFESEPKDADMFTILQIRKRNLLKQCQRDYEQKEELKKREFQQEQDNTPTRQSPQTNVPIVLAHPHPFQPSSPPQSTPILQSKPSFEAPMNLSVSPSKPKTKNHSSAATLRLQIAAAAEKRLKRQ